MRVIVAGRLSRKVSDRDQTGLDSQERESVRWAETNGHEIVAVVADHKSGRSGLESRPNLRPWITDPARLASYDGIVALKVDRLTRGNKEETAKLEHWARVNGKALLIAGADVRFPSEGTDGIQWDLMLRMAHQEWLSISERYRRMQRTLAERGSLVGRIPWGYSIVRDNGIKTLAPDPELRPFLTGMVTRYLDGASLQNVADWLDAEGIPADRGGQWSAKSVSQILDNPILRGRRVFTITTNRKRQRFTMDVDPVISASQWKALRTKRATVRRRGPALTDAAMLTGIATCGVCDGPMYRHYSNNKRADGSIQRIAYYRCMGKPPKQRSTCANMIRLDTLDGFVGEYLTGPLARALEMVEQTVTPGTDHADEIDAVDQQIRDLDPADADWLDQAAALKAERDRLAALPTVPPDIVLSFTGQSLAGRWAALNGTQSRRTFLTDAGCTVRVRPGQRPDVAVTFPDAVKVSADGGARVAVAFGRPE